MTKTKFRSRKLDYKRHLEVYREDEIVDFDPNDLNRPIEEVETGVEKEEEKEHHLQVALSQSHAEANGARTAVHIPTPSTTSRISNYNKLYNKQFSQPKTLIKYIPHNIEDIFEQYDVDNIDQNWLISFNSSSKKIDNDSFEQIMYVLEQMHHKGLISLTHHDSVDSFNFKQNMPSIKIEDSVLDDVFQYWKQRKKHITTNTQQLIPRLEHEDKANKEIDPYVCFRKREIKPTRKTRRSELQSFKKLLKLKTELNQTLDILSMVSKREKLRKELVMLEMLEFNYMWSTIEKGEYQHYKRALSSVIPASDKTPLNKSSKIKLSISKSNFNKNKPTSTSNLPKPISIKIEQEPMNHTPSYLYPSFVNRSELPNLVLIPEQFPFSSVEDKEPVLVGYNRRRGRGGIMFVDRVVLQGNTNFPDLSDEYFPILDAEFYSPKSIAKIVPNVQKTESQSIYPKEPSSVKENPSKDLEPVEKPQNNKT